MEHLCLRGVPRVVRSPVSLIRPPSGASKAPGDDAEDEGDEVESLGSPSARPSSETLDIPMPAFIEANSARGVLCVGGGSLTRISV